MKCVHENYVQCSGFSTDTADPVSIIECGVQSDEYLKKKQLLQTPSEQSRLLLEIPNVIADEVEEEARPQEGNNASPKSIFWEAIEISSHDLETNQILTTQNSDSVDAADPSWLFAKPGTSFYGFYCKFSCSWVSRRWERVGHCISCPKVPSAIFHPFTMHEPGVPLKDVSKLSKIASAVEKPLFTHNVIAERKRLAYARICVEITPTSPFRHSVDIVGPDGSKYS
ncbi:hypothetical protein RHGRI_025326 [Rhododendron griersonianum]|uniref:Uncharacterized protein n=1 Tax=Rhododendron griersonianum TaxID=479676 RepID=A0AAV6IPA9_9ERIC|nr:hypothetical protein RHGRI_025326 [Rhododendron griersonianum]